MDWRDNRCANVAPGAGEHRSVRCQLMPHNDDQHVAMISQNPRPEHGVRATSASEYRTWGEPWTKSPPGHGWLPWAISFPRIESWPG
jgi:hypothetical protein